ncbi:hypothetical protein EDB89DRAFT_1908542 [Lactarius sanguifluus]|nr:hypothetical protein EDB89DRAFT_1908542 [Lactarius sanguifluus]
MTWVSFFKSYPVLKGFWLYQGPQFDIEGDQQAHNILQNLEQLYLSALTWSTSSPEDRLLGVQLSHLNLSSHRQLNQQLLKNRIMTHPYAMPHASHCQAMDGGVDVASEMIHA